MTVLSFLLVYDRAAGRLLREERFESRAEALRERFATEKQYRDQGANIEVVVVNAPTREQLLRTHGRYFLTVDELAARITATH